MIYHLTEKTGRK
uniref:Uncharacterized protein n=1 Tax=Anguilla anguilla TaxID=7936 RepID=A0A0E9T0F9_ANGAN